MKKTILMISTLILLTCVSCSGVRLPFSPTETPTPTITRTPTPSQTVTPSPTATPTLTKTPTPEYKTIQSSNDLFILTVPWSFTIEDFKTGYDQSAVKVSDEEGNFTMVLALIPNQGFSISTWTTLLLIVYERESGLQVDQDGLAYAATRTFDITLNSMAGEGFGFTGSVADQRVEGEILGLALDSESYLMAFAYIHKDGMNAWDEQAKETFMHVLESLTFNN